MIRNGNVAEIVARFENAKGRRNTLNSHLQEIAELTWPDAADFTIQRTPEAQGDRRTQRIFDSTAPQSLERFAAVFESLITPRHRVWHRLRAFRTLMNKDPEVTRWLDDVNETLFDYRQRPSAGFYSAAHECYKQLGAFGTCVLFVEAEPAGGIRYRSCSLAQTWFEADALNRPKVVYRTYNLTAWAAYDRWGERCSSKVKASLKTNPFESFEFLHVVVPATDTSVRGMQFDSAEIDLGAKEIMEWGGYRDMPYMISRYTLNPNETYGRSPMMLVLPDVLTLNEMEKTHLRVGHNLAEPPLLANNDGVLGVSSPIDLRPKGITYGGIDDQGRIMVAPLNTGGRLDITIEMMEGKRDSIKRALLVDLFAMVAENPQKTATEVLEIAKEKGQMITPAIGRQQTEFAGPCITREVGILYMQGNLPDPPAQLLSEQEQYKIEYESDATALQKAGIVTSILRLFEVLAPAVNLNPSLFDQLINIEEVARISGEALTVPTVVLRTPKERQAIQEAQAEQARQAQQVDQAPDLAAAAKDAVEALGGAQRLKGLPGGLAAAA